MSNRSMAELLSKVGKNTVFFLNYKRFCATMLYVWEIDRAYIVRYTGRMHKVRLFLCFVLFLQMCLYCADTFILCGYVYTVQVRLLCTVICSGEEKEESTGWKRRN